MDGILVSGTTGESPTLTVEEKVRLITEMRSAIDPSVMIWAGTSSYNTAESVRLTKLAESAGADGILAVTLITTNRVRKVCICTLKTISESTSLPIMLYNVPGRTSVNLLPDTVGRLSELGNVKAIKEASGSLDQVTGVFLACPQDFYVYSGDDSLIFANLICWRIWRRIGGRSSCSTRTQKI